MHSNIINLVSAGGGGAGDVTQAELNGVSGYLQSGYIAADLALSGVLTTAILNASGAAVLTASGIADRLYAPKVVYGSGLPSPGISGLFFMDHSDAIYPDNFSPTLYLGLGAGDPYEREWLQLVDSRFLETYFNDSISYYTPLSLLNSTSGYLVSYTDAATNATLISAKAYSDYKLFIYNLNLSRIASGLTMDFVAYKPNQIKPVHVTALYANIVSTVNGVISVGGNNPFSPVWQLFGNNNSVTSNWYLRSGQDETWETPYRIWHSGDFSQANVNTWNGLQTVITNTSGTLNNKIWASGSIVTAIANASGAANNLYLQKNGSTPLTANWYTGTNNITTSGLFNCSGIFSSIFESATVVSSVATFNGIQNRSSVSGAINALFFCGTSGFANASINTVQNNMGNEGNHLVLQTKVAGAGAWNANQLFLNTNGNVGIKTATPERMLDVANSAIIGSRAFASANNEPKNYIEEYLGTTFDAGSAGVFYIPLCRYLSTGANFTGFSGRIKFYRGNPSASRISHYVDITVSNAYTEVSIDQFETDWIDGVRLVRATIGGLEYVMLASTGKVSSVDVFANGVYRGITPTMYSGADAAALNITVIALITIPFITKTSAGNVGIGTATPTSLLHLMSGPDNSLKMQYNNAVDNRNILSFVNSLGNGQAEIQQGKGNRRKTFTGGFIAAEDDLVINNIIAAATHFGTADVPRVTINSTGNVGIGTVTPGAKIDALDTNRSANEANVLIRTSDAQAAGKGGTLALGGMFTTAADNYAPFGALRGIKENDTTANYAGALRFDTISNGGTLSEKMRITSVGNVGINAAIPVSKLDVSGVITASGGNSTNWNTVYNASLRTTVFYPFPKDLTGYGMAFTSGTLGRVMFDVPYDFVSLNSFQLICVPVITASGNRRVRIDTTYGKVGESYVQHSNSAFYTVDFGPHTVTRAIELSAYLPASLQALDVGYIFIGHMTDGVIPPPTGITYYYGLRLDYNRY